MTALWRMPRMHVMHILRGIARQALVGAALSLVALTALPQTPSLYTVEMVVFRNDGTTGALPAADTPAAATDDGIEVTPAETSKLNAAVAKLRKAGITVLAHVAWTQGPTAFALRQGVTADRLGVGNGLVGKVYLLRGKFLDLGVDLTFEQGGQLYRINEMRDIKANDIQYFDHPAVGVIAIVTAVTGG
jgi:hypothetical protein